LWHIKVFSACHNFVFRSNERTMRLRALGNLHWLKWHQFHGMTVERLTWCGVLQIKQVLLRQIIWFCIVLDRDLVFVLEVPFQNIHDGGLVFQTQIEWEESETITMFPRKFRLRAFFLTGLNWNATYLSKLKEICRSFTDPKVVVTAVTSVVLALEIYDAMANSTTKEGQRV